MHRPSRLAPARVSLTVSSRSANVTRRFRANAARTPPGVSWRSSGAAAQVAKRQRIVRPYVRRAGSARPRAGAASPARQSAAARSGDRPTSKPSPSTNGASKRCSGTTISGAAELLESVLRHYPEEKELHERVRLYLNICQRQATPREAAPQTIEERLYASTLAINGGRYDEAISHLRLVRDEDPDNDHALYMLAVAHAQRGEHAEAIAHLERAIALNPENRALARRDPDLEPLRDDEAFRAALDTPAAPRADRRRPDPHARPRDQAR